MREDLMEVYWNALSPERQQALVNTILAQIEAHERSARRRHNPDAATRSRNETALVVYAGFMGGLSILAAVVAIGYAAGWWS